MPAGPMRDRVRLERRVDVLDAHGNYGGAWQEIATLWAEIRPLSRGEAVLAGKLQGTRTAEIRLRYSSVTAAITADDRVVEVRDGTAWNIRAAEDRERRRHTITLLAETGVAT